MQEVTPEKTATCDILVEFRKGATLLDLTGLGNFLEGKLGRRVDVVSQISVREELRLNILPGADSGRQGCNLAGESPVVSVAHRTRSDYSS